MLSKESFPGYLLLIAVALVSMFASTFVVLGGKHPLEASALAVVIGIALRSLNRVPEMCKAGVNKSEKLLVFGIVLMGASLDVATVTSQGWSWLAIILITMLLGFFLIYFLSKAFGLSQGLGILLSVGTTICGTSAIAVTAPLIKAKEEETSYAVGTVALWGLVAILLYPYLGRLVHASDLHFGIFAGTAIHSTPQVVGAGFIFSDLAGKTATTVKLVRNCFMAPVAILIAVWYSRNGGEGTLTRQNLMRAFPWFLFGYFIMAACNSNGLFSARVSSNLTESGKFLILLGMAGVGLSTNFRAFKAAGTKPLIVGLIGSIIVAAVSALLIAALL